MSRSKVLVLISGSIAAYKACYLISKMVQAGHEVKVVASQSALQFVGIATLEGLSGKPVAHNTFETGSAMDHINLIRWADIVICIPATANFINKLASGIGDDLLSTLALAHDFKKPFLIAPAMNVQMYLHPATQKSLKTLREYGFAILETASGVLACGEEGFGKLLDPDLIYEEISLALPPIAPQEMRPAPKIAPILITSGGTIEAIDSVRSITNTSSGKTGAMIGDVLLELGFEIEYLGAKNGAAPVAQCNTSTFTDFKSLENLLFAKLEKQNYSAIIHCAAISDYSVASIIADGRTCEAGQAKLPSDMDEISIKLKRNPKLISQIKAKSKNKAIKLFGFKLTDFDNKTDITQSVKKQIETSGCDYVVQNNIEEIKGDKSQHIYHIFDAQAQEKQKCVGAKNLAIALAETIYLGENK